MRGPDQLGENRVELGCWAEQQWPGVGRKAGTPVTVTVAGPPLGLRRWVGALPGPALNWVTSGVAALPAHLVQEASFWPRDRGRTGTEKACRDESSLPGGPRTAGQSAQHPARHRAASMPASRHVPQASTSPGAQLLPGSRLPSPAHPWVAVGPGRGRHPGLRWYPGGPWLLGKH